MPASVEVVGLADFRKALRALGPQWVKALTKVHKTIATRTASVAQGYATGMGGIQARAASAIRSRADMSSARIGILATGNNAMANAAFFGAKRHTGWYAKGRYHDSPAQFPPWVGNTWEVAVAGQGPYAINPALAALLPTILDEYGHMIDELVHDAFPN